MVATGIEITGWINEMFKEYSKQDGVMDWTQNKNGKNNIRNTTLRFLSSKTRRIPGHLLGLINLEEAEVWGKNSDNGFGHVNQM